ncbi:enkurin-like isoform X1 [Polyodon spathula]|uniref:enkurin-like isoform X1 n=2 Tax=Polyodon spathula TaxID=7913 RepID=UPI001B7EE596|nr:enkurin-like isoform X1 [Polyodon spathula]
MTDMFPAESIYNLIPREEVKVTKQPRHTSKFRETVKEETQRHKAPNKTMGPVKVDVPSPEKFLQKHSKEPKLADTTEGGLLEKPLKKLCGDQKKPRLPLRTDHPVMGIQTKKNFIKTNAVETIMSVPKKPQPNYVDTRRGDKQLLDTSGLVPKFTNKKDYGQTPEYLIKRNEEVQRAQEEYDAYIKERIRQGSMKQLSDEERDAVLQGLKKNWGELHHQYQGISVVTDTTPKKYRKERLETEMKQLEKDIDMIERHKTIYIANK